MKKTVQVIQYVDVEYDETKFTKEFMEAFEQTMFDYTTIEEHIKHLATLEAKGEAGGFVEGYGELKDDMGISLIVVDAEADIL